MTASFPRANDVVSDKEKKKKKNQTFSARMRVARWMSCSKRCTSVCVERRLPAKRRMRANFFSLNERSSPAISSTNTCAQMRHTVATNYFGTLKERKKKKKKTTADLFRMRQRTHRRVAKQDGDIHHCANERQRVEIILFRFGGQQVWSGQVVKQVVHQLRRHLRHVELWRLK